MSAEPVVILFPDEIAAWLASTPPPPPRPDDPPWWSGVDLATGDEDAAPPDPDALRREAIKYTIARRDA